VNQPARLRSGLHRAFVATVFVLGVAAIVDALFTLHRSPAPYLWLVLALLTIASDAVKSFKISGPTAHVSPSEIFLFLIVLLFGGAPAVVTLAVGGLTFALRRERIHKGRRDYRYHYAAFNLAEPALSAWAASKAYLWLGGVDALWANGASVAQIAWPALAMSAVYFILNSGLTAVAEAGTTGSSPFALWWKYFKDVSIDYVSNASIAVILAVNLPSRDVIDGLTALAAGASGVAQKLMSGGLTESIGALAVVNPQTIAVGLLSDAVIRVLLVLATVVAVVIPLVIVPYLNLALSTARLKDQDEHLREINQINVSLAETLAMMAEEADEATSLGHIRSVRRYSLWLAYEMGWTDPDRLEALGFASLLHDLGKARIPDYIWRKPVRLTDAEHRMMETHPAIGARLAERISHKFRLGVAPIIQHHHENWDGTGYPDRLSGEAIPLGARIVQVADCYDALRRARPYRPAWSHEEALAIVRERAGSMYDPAVVRAFEAIQGLVAAEHYEEAASERPDAGGAPAAIQPVKEDTASMPSALRASGRSALTQLFQHLGRLDPHAGLDVTCEIVAGYLRRLAPASLVVFYRRDATSNEVVAVHASGYCEDLVRGVRMPLGRNVSGWVAANGQSIINANPVLDAIDALTDIEPGFKSLLSVPLTRDDATVGAVTLYATHAAAFRDDHRLALELVSGAVSDAMELAARSAGPAGAASPAAEPPGPASEADLEGLLAMDRRTSGIGGRARAVLCLRNAGDPAVMIHAAMAMSQATRIADLIFRPTPDSLVVLMNDADAAAGELVTQRIAAALPHDIVAPPDDSSPLRIGFAFGPRDGDYWSELLAIAQRRASAAEAPAAAEVTIGEGGQPCRA
jgi:hypothetical protein